MTPERVEAALEKLTDNQVVQGEMLARLEQVVARNSEAIADLAGGQLAMQSAVVRMAEGMQTMQGSIAVMQAAMDRLFEHMDRFIRGLEGNGHKSA